MTIKKGLYLRREAARIAAENGFPRSTFWWESMVRNGSIKSVRKDYGKMKGVHFITGDEIKRVIKKRPVLVLEKAVKVLLIALLIASRPLFAAELTNWNKITIHHTATQDGKEYSREQCDKDHRARGWESCGYNYLVEPDGRIVEARGLSKIGAHTAGNNTGNIGIAIVGNEAITDREFESLRFLIDSVTAKFGKLPIYPHRHFKSTICPGDGVWMRIKSQWPMRSMY